jgi:hypothetical protein
MRAPASGSVLFSWERVSQMPCAVFGSELKFARLAQGFDFGGGEDAAPAPGLLGEGAANADTDGGFLGFHCKVLPAIPAGAVFNGPKG